MDGNISGGAVPSGFDRFHNICSSETLDPKSFHPSFCNNASANHTSDIFQLMDESSYIQRVVVIVVPILFGVIILIGLFGNGLVVVVVSANQQMKSTTNYLILNLAIADLLFVIFCVPFTATDYALPAWPYGLVWCKTVQYLIHVTAYVSVYTLVLMSVDRFLAVVRPVESMSYRTERNAILACVLLWIVVLVCCIPVYIAHGIYPYSPDFIHVYEKCLYLSIEFSLPAFQISFFITSYAIPLGIIVTLYILMLFRLWRAGPRGGNRTSEAHLRDKRRATRLVIVVVVIFAVCWLPIQVILVLKSLDMMTEMNLSQVLIQAVSNALAYMNSCVNPILYAFLSESFRKAFRKVIPCHRMNGMLLNGRNDGPTPPTRATPAGCSNNRLKEVDFQLADCQESKPL